MSGSPVRHRRLAAALCVAVALGVCAPGTGEAQTASGILLGTPEYMAPEQLEGAHKIGPAADIFAMGAILYRAITGHQVFSGPNLVAVIKSMAVDEGAADDPFLPAVQRTPKVEERPPRPVVEAPDLDIGIGL